MTPDIYTTTKGAERPMVCADCGGHFAGTDRNVFATGPPRHKVITLCDNCIKDARGR